MAYCVQMQIQHLALSCISLKHQKAWKDSEKASNESNCEFVEWMAY